MQESSLTKLQPATFLKKYLTHRYFPLNFAKFLTFFVTEHLRPTASISPIINPAKKITFRLPTYSGGIEMQGWVKMG